MLSSPKDPSCKSPPSPPPILCERIILTIRHPLERLHQEGVPSWYPEIEAAITKLVQLGLQISISPETAEITQSLQALNSAVSPFNVTIGIINSQLIRNIQHSVKSRYDNGFLGVFLALLDQWLRACERHCQKNCRKFSEEVSAFEACYKDLTTIATPHIANDPYRFDHLLYLFDDLGLTNAL